MSLINNTIIIGIDVSKDKLDIHILPLEHSETLDNRRKSIKAFLHRVRCDYSVEKIVLEATGGYERVLVKEIHALGLVVHVAHPSQVYHFAKAKKLLAKTDKIDARTLALFGQEKETRATEIKSNQQEELEALVRRKQQLTGLLTQEKLRLGGPTAIGEMKRSIKRIVKQLEREITQINKKLEQGIQQDEALWKKVQCLTSYKGIGLQTAMQLVVSMRELGQTTRAGIASLMGLAPFNRDSGKKQGYRSIIGGRFHARKAIYMAALSAIRYNPAMKVFYQRLREKGKMAKVAIVAVMRKIIITLNAMVRDNKNWEPNLNFLKGA